MSRIGRRGVQQRSRAQVVFVVVLTLLFVAVSTWIGIQWFVDGLRAGYPYLAMVGAAVIAVGIAVDLILYLFVPAGGGRSLLVLAMGPWTMRVCGVEYDAAKRFLEQLGDTWKAD